MPVEILDRHGRIYHLRLTAPSPPNAAAYIFAVGDELIHARGGSEVPKPQIVAERREQRALPCGRPFVQICGIKVPKVAHRRVTVTNMSRGGGRQYALGGSRFTADDQIVSAQIELLKSQRHKRKELPVAAAQRIEKRCSDFVPPDLWTDRGGIVKQGENVGVGEEPAKRFQHFFAATPVQQPIVDDGRAHVT